MHSIVGFAWMLSLPLFIVLFCSRSLQRDVFTPRSAPWIFGILILIAAAVTLSRLSEFAVPGGNVAPILGEWTPQQAGDFFSLLFVAYTWTRSLFVFLSRLTNAK